MQLEAADWSIQATPPVHLQGFTPDGGHFSVAYEAYADDSWVKRVIYRLQEFSGLSSF